MAAVAKYSRAPKHHALQARLANSRSDFSILVSIFFDHPTSCFAGSLCNWLPDALLLFPSLVLTFCVFRFAFVLFVFPFFSFLKEQQHLKQSLVDSNAYCPFVSFSYIRPSLQNLSIVIMPWFLYQLKISITMICARQLPVIIVVTCDCCQQSVVCFLLFLNPCCCARNLVAIVVQLSRYL